MATRITGLEQISNGYEVLLCDVWGVIHNGIRPYPSACEALSRARATGTTITLITNSPMLGETVSSHLETLGVPSGAYDRIVTAGDVTRAHLGAASRRVFHIGRAGEEALLLGTKHRITSAEEAEVIICTGLFDDTIDRPEHYDELLASFLRRAVPLVCANPDIVVENGSLLIPCAGAVAARYEQMGGSVISFGKPNREIYKQAIAASRAVRGDFEDQKILAIGDGIKTDIKGAAQLGFDSLFIASGVHLKNYAISGDIEDGALESWLEREGHHPKYWIPHLA